MSNVVKPYLTTLTKNPLIDAATEITDAVYALLPDFPESEKWDSAARLQQAANYLLSSIAKSVGNSAPNGSEFDWSNSRKEVAVLVTMLRFSVKHDFIGPQSELLLQLNDLLKQIDKQTIAAYERRNTYEQYEISLWEEKYEMWKKLNSELRK